jgi:hypothetical protein
MTKDEVSLDTDLLNLLMKAETRFRRVDRVQAVYGRFVSYGERGVVLNWATYELLFSTTFT